MPIKPFSVSPAIVVRAFSPHLWLVNSYAHKAIHSVSPAIVVRAFSPHLWLVNSYAHKAIHSVSPCYSSEGIYPTPMACQ